MRILLLIIAVFAVANFSLHEYLDRTAKRDVIISAFKEHAIAACQREATGVAQEPEAWARAANVILKIGKSDLDVYIWQTKHKLWRARYKNPYLYVTLNRTADGMYCEYDINNDIASVHNANATAANPAG
jgi:hypothetical protein